MMFSSKIRKRTKFHFEFVGIFLSTRNDIDLALQYVSLPSQCI